MLYRSVPRRLHFRPHCVERRRWATWRRLRVCSGPGTYQSGDQCTDIAGSGLAGLSGVGMMLVARIHPKRTPWLVAHVVVAAMVAMLIVFSLVIPAGQQTLAEPWPFSPNR